MNKLLALQNKKHKQAIGLSSGTSLDGVDAAVATRGQPAEALLANETIYGNPGNVTAATGASSPAILGKISF